MIRVFLIAVAVAARILLFSDAALGAEIKGKVAAPGMSEAGLKIRVSTPDLVMVAQGETTDKGSFAIEAGDTASYPWLLVEASINNMSLSGIFVGGTGTIDVISDTIAGAVFGCGAPAVNFTKEEIKTMEKAAFDRASGIDTATARTAAQGVETLLSNQAYRLALGSMASSYATPGNTIDENKEVEDFIKGILSAFPAFQNINLDNVLTPDALIVMGAGAYKTRNELPGAAEDFLNQFKIKSWDVELARTIIQGDTAIVETVEKISLEERASGQNITDILNITHNLVKSEDGWRISKREEKDCVPAKTLILADGSSRDWIGVSPCITRYFRRETVASGSANINALYFASDGVDFSWRMEFDGEWIKKLIPSGEADSGKKNQPGISFIVVFADKMGEEAKIKIFSTVGVMDGVIYSLNQVSRPAPDGVQEDVTYMNNEFSLTPGCAEGTISMENLGAIKGDLYAGGLIIYEEKGDQGVTSKVLSEGVPVKIKFSPKSIVPTSDIGPE